MIRRENEIAQDALNIRLGLVAQQPRIIRDDPVVGVLITALAKVGKNAPVKQAIILNEYRASLNNLIVAFVLVH